RHEVESLLRQVVGLASMPAAPGLHVSWLHEVRGPGGENVRRHLQALLQFAESRHSGECRVPNDEQAPTLARGLEGPLRGADLVLICASKHDAECSRDHLHNASEWC